MTIENQESIKVESLTQEGINEIYNRKARRIAIFAGIGIGVAAAMIYAGKVLKDNEVVDIIEVVEEITD